ncbi:hypothetical protein BH11PSE8_BH11PSE8_10670 [soil metagenome]
MYLRLRQLCLVAAELDPVVDALSDVFGVTVCHRDPEVGRFGLHNALLPLGTSFIEVVAPLQPGTTAGRYLERRGGDGGYMVILDSESLPRWREHVAQIGVRIAAPLAIGGYEGMQLHPRDTGGALLEINSTVGGENIDSAYWPAGPHWQEFVRTERVLGIVGAELQGSEPAAMAARWGQILQRPVHNASASGGASLPVDNATLRFVPATDGRGDGLGGIDLRVVDVGAVIAAAKARGCTVDETLEAPIVVIGGVRFSLRT